MHSMNTDVCKAKSLMVYSPCSPHPGAALPPSSSSQPPLPSLQLEHRFTTSSSPHYFTYLPSLSQPSVVMLYRPEQVTEGQKSPRLECEEVRKRRWEEREEEETVAKKKGASGLEECSEVFIIVHGSLFDNNFCFSVVIIRFMSVDYFPHIYNHKILFAFLDSEALN